MVCLSLSLAVMAVGCSNAPAPPPDTRAADVQGVKDVEAAWVKDVRTKDADKWASYFTDDGSGLYPGAGRAMASKGGDMVYSQGTYTMNLTDPKTKKLMTDKGKYLTVFTKQADGSWKAVADTFNSDSPM